MKTYKFTKQITINGKRKVFRADSQRELNRKIMAYQGEMEKGALFSAVAEEWKKDAYPKLSPNTLKGYNGSLNRALAHFGNDKIKKITPLDIDTFLKKTTAQGYARHTVNNDRLILNLVFNYAVVNGYIEINPCAAVKTPKNTKKEKRKPPSPQEREAVARTVETPMGFFAYFLSYTGLRLGEALALKGEDLNLEDHVISVNKSLYWQGNVPKIKEPKTEAGIRQVAILDVLIPFLKDVEKQDILFNNGGTYYTRTVFEKRWKRYARENHITSTPHCFRHLYATFLYDAGIAPKDAQQLLGHAQLSTTMDIYTDIEEARKVKTYLKLNEYVHTSHTPTPKNTDDC